MLEDDTSSLCMYCIHDHKQFNKKSFKERIKIAISFKHKTYDDNISLVTKLLLFDIEYDNRIDVFYCT